MIKIKKQLSRNDGSKIAAGSIIIFDPKFNILKKEVSFFCSLYLTLSALENGKNSIKDSDLKLRYFKKCTDLEWEKINEAGVFSLVEGWLVEALESVVGVGNVEII